MLLALNLKGMIIAAFLGLTVECTSADSELGNGVTISFVLNDMTLYVLQNKS